ncbi:MAG: DUF7670 domain-containing protein [Candidatus Nanoarchaeia archaeon]
MKKRSKKELHKFKPINKDWIYWTPRILSILFILFLALFSLDVFDSCQGFIECLIGLFMHNIPVFVLIAVLIVSWKHEIVGAAVFALAGIFYVSLILRNIFLDSSNIFMLFWTLPISLPAFLIAILFYICWKNKRK